MEIIVLIPVLAGLLALFIDPQRGKIILPIAGIMHFVASIMSCAGSLKILFPNYVAFSPEGGIVLLLTSFLFLMISFYSLSYLKYMEGNRKIFVSAMLFFLAAMSLVTISDHLILFWIAVEATTIASTPLIFIHKSKEAFEATWKYILICSVGIAIALLGTFLIAIATDKSGLAIDLTFTSLMQQAHVLDLSWLKAAFIFILIGYGTKTGLAPMHTWLPDAHSEAPGPASALLSGALLNTAFLGIFKITKILKETSLSGFVDNALIIFGLLSVVMGGIFILKQKDYKRMLAYSSIENMGIISLGLGIGGLASVGAMIHLIHHSLIKSSLFLSAGNILLSLKTKVVKDIGELSGSLKATFVLFFIGILAISGFPPFGLFFSELLIFIGGIQKEAYVVVAIFSAALILVVAGLIQIVIKMSFGKSNSHLEVKDDAWRVIPQIILLLTSIILVFYQGPELKAAINSALISFGGKI